MLEKLRFQQLIEGQVTLKRLTTSMPAVRFVLAMILALYVGFSRLNHWPFLQWEPMLTGILEVVKLPVQSTFWRFLASLHLVVARQLLEVGRRMRQRVWEAAHVELRAVAFPEPLECHVDGRQAMSRFFAAAILAAVASGLLHAQCEPSAPVRQVLDKATLPGEDGLSQAEQKARRTAILNEGLKQYPHDYFLLGRLTIYEEDTDAKIRAAKAAREKYPDQPVYELIYAVSLMGRDTPETIRLLEGLKKSHPELTRAHYVLVYVAGGGKFKDRARVKTELDAFLAACPAPLDAGALNIISVYGTKEQIAGLIPALRQRLEKETDPLLSSAWELLWRMEFKARPPAEHAALRKQIGQELARFAQSPEAQQLRWMEFLRGGYQSAGDLTAADRISDQILERYPQSSAAKGILEERWRKQHPYPQSGDAAQIEAWSRAALEAYQEWHQRWPDDSLRYSTVFTSLVNLPETTAERIAKVGDELMAAYRKNPRWWGMPPVEFRVAGEFARRKVNLDKVPGLVEEGYRSSLKREEDDLRDDRNTQEILDMCKDNLTILKIERARVLLDYYEAVKQPQKAREIEAELAALQPAKPYGKSMLLEAQGHAAELGGRKLDALMMYRAALEMRQPGQAPAGGKDTLAGNVERLWKELGGTPAAWPLLTDQKKVQEAAESRWERPKNPLPAFALSDLDGKTWKLASLEGKAVLINVWATWCGPCKAEHPEFQKLYEKLKGRSDVTVLSFNVDDDLGKVAPYMNENKYTFPVLLAHDLVLGYLPVVAIPQNWFLDTTGKLQWIQVGYGGDPKWQEMMTAKLDEVLKTAR